MYRAHKYGASLSPDGEWIVFALQEPGPYHDLYAMRLDGSGPTRITYHPASGNDAPRWVDVGG
ncbi:MAG TPA: hypothetical protein VFX65_03460 [Candidatus Limnocylindrales bacterium]|nr:hypothetical protein [Candidatus Limnocylindrales bacterium]